MLTHHLMYICYGGTCQMCVRQRCVCYDGGTALARCVCYGGTFFSFIIFFIQIRGWKFKPITLRLLGHTSYQLSNHTQHFMNNQFFFSFKKNNEF